MDDTFKPGDRVEVIASGLRGTVTSTDNASILVELDQQPERPGAMTIIDMSGDRAIVTTVFDASQIRRIAIPSA